MPRMNLELYDALVDAGMPEEHARKFAITIERRIDERNERMRQQRIAGAEAQMREWRRARGRYVPPKRG